MEYECEVEETRGRVRALLEKLRIPAEVHAFWLASGELATYAAIVHGHSEDASAEQIVEEVLEGEEWWTQLQRLRGKGAPMTASQELASLAQMVEPTAEQRTRHNSHDDQLGRRRLSMAIHGRLPKKPTVSSLSRLGVSVGIRTHSLPHKIFQLDSEDSDGPGGHESSDDSEPDSDSDDVDSTASDSRLDGYQTPTAFAWVGRRKSHGDALLSRPVRRRDRAGVEALVPPGPSAQPSYGTLSAPTATASDGGSEVTPAAPSSQGVTRGSTLSAQALSPVLEQHREPPSDPQSPWISTTNIHRPAILRTASSSMRFSSSLVPEAKITEAEGSGPTLRFSDATAPTPAWSERPAISKSRSASQLPAVSGFQIKAADAGGLPSLGGPHAESAGDLPQSLAPPGGNNNLRLDIPELATREATETVGDGDSGSSYATQDLPLSFNDLPSRAQHLILNELMRQNSADTVVLLTTLPTPEEGTCKSEEASVRYLSDIELLCHELPPTLLVLSNTMTVTVSL